MGELVSYLCKYKINKEVSLETKQLSNTGFAKFKTWPRFRGQKTKTLTQKTLDAFLFSVDFKPKLCRKCSKLADQRNYHDFRLGSNECPIILKD